MASIETRISNGKKTYRVKIRIKGFPSQSATFSSITKAKEWGSRTENEIKDGKYLSKVKSKQHTVNEMIDKYIISVLPRKPKVERDWTRYLNTMKELLGNYSLFEATPSQIAEARDKIANVRTNRGGLRSASTVNNHLKALSSVYGYAVDEWEWLDANPMRKVKKLPEPKGRVRYLENNEREQLMEACKAANNPYLYTVVMLALTTGARKMEILSLTWKQVDLVNNRVILEDTKNNERRSLPIVKIVHPMLKELYKNKKCDLVFPSKDLLKPFDITRSWRNAVKKAELKDFRFHDLRHTAASYLAMNGASMGEIADVLGHKSLQMTKRYSHLSDAHKKSVVESMTNKIFGGE